MKMGSYGRWIVRSLLAGALVLGFLGMVNPVLADDASESRQLVEKARMTLEDYIKAPEMEGFRAYLKGARGIFIAPQILKGAFVVGVSGGTGLFFARDKHTQRWVGPAFYTIGEGSFGFQAGGEASEVIFLAMTERGVTALLGNSAKIGGDINAAAGPVGGGVTASTENLSADILTWARSKGLFGGVSLNGAVVAVRKGLNDAYYGKKGLSPTDILVKEDVSSAHSHTLIELITKTSNK